MSQFSTSEVLISNLNRIADPWAEWMTAMAWQVSVLVIVLALVAWLLRHRSARLRYAIWMLVPLRLVLPPTLAFATSWGWWLLPAIIEPSDKPPANVISMPIAAQSPALPVQLEFADVFDPAIRETPPLEPETAVAVPSQPPTNIRWQGWLFLLWCTGVLLLSARLLYYMIRTTMVLRALNTTHLRDVFPEQKQLAGRVELCKQRIGLRRNVQLRVSSPGTSPMVIGFWRPVVLLPSGIGEYLSESELDAVLLHELHHIARHDSFVSFTQSIMSVAYFFHPLVWYSNRSLNRLREDACDESTLSTLKGDRRDYGSGLVKVAEMMTEPAPRMALGIAESTGQVKRRLQRILDPKCPIGSRLSWLSLLFVALSAIALLPSAAQRAEPKSETAKSKQVTTTNGNDSEDEKTSGDAAEEQERQTTIRGVVVDSANQPVAGVIIRAESMFSNRGPVVGSADEEGAFELTAYESQLRGASVVAMTKDRKSQGSETRPWSKEDFASVPYRLMLRSASNVTVDVVDGDGNPVADATVFVQPSLPSSGLKKTSDTGRAEFLLPADMPVEYIYAMKDRLGADYRAYVVPREMRGDQQAKAPELPSGPVQLTLEEAKPVRVRIVDANDQPIAGVRIQPWYLSKPDQNDIFNFSFMTKHVTQETDSDGEVAFNWIPAWNDQAIVFWASAIGYGRERITYDPETHDGSLTVNLQQLVPIRGHVMMPDGSPAKGISVLAIGAGYHSDRFNESATTDENGDYELFASPNMVYLVTAQSEKLASNPQTGFAAMPATPIDNLDFQLRPATRLFGKVTVGKNRKPVEGQRIFVYQYGDDAHNTEGVKLPNPEGKKLWVQPLFQRMTTTDVKGQFEVLVGNGRFDIRGPKQVEIEKFTISDELQREFNFHADHPESGILTGTVVDAETGEPIADATVTGIYRNHMANGDLAAKTDSHGTFAAERELHTTVLRANNKTKTMGGVVEIGPEGETVTIPIGRLASATGVLVDAETRQPRAGQEISYGVNVSIGDGQFRPSFGGTTTTDDKGRFRVDSLLLRQEYTISATIRGETEYDISWRTLGTVTPESAAEIDLGQLELKPTHRPPTIDDQITKAFAEDGSRGTPAERFDSAKRDAALSKQHVLVFIGDPAAESVKQWMRLRYEDTETRRAFDPYRVLQISTAAIATDEATKLIDKLKLPSLPSKDGFLVAISDSDGDLLVSETEQTLAPDGAVDQGKLLALLHDHAPGALDAKQLLSDALAEAKRQNKRVIVQETATWCAPCWLLSRFLEQNRDDWEQDYIWVKMDHRWEHAVEIMKEYRDGAEGGVPWWAILDSAGKILVTSNGPDGGNIGFPSGKAGIAHFRTMFEETAIRMTNNDIERLVKSLDKDSIATDTQPKVPSGFQTKPSPKTFPRVRPNPPAAANLDEAKLRRNESGEVIDFHLSGKSNLDRLAITPEVIDAILEHRNLESLSLWGTTTDDKAIERLSDLKKLIAIDLTYTDVTGESLKSLARLPKLVSLRLEGCDVEDSQLAGLSQIPDLMMLYLGKTKVTDDGLTYIRPLKELSLLDLSDCTITDDGLRSLGDLPKLQHLWLSKTIRYGEDDRSELTDECLDYLSSLTTLRELKIADSRLSDRGLADLRKTLPKANIDTERSGVTYIQSKK